MTTMRYLLLGVTLACFIGGGLSVTDQELQMILKSVNTAMVDIRKDIQDLVSVVTQQAQDIMQLRTENKYLKELLQNNTVEERLEVLETQVVEIEEDISDLDEDVDFLFDEQVIQDERLFSLEQTSNSLNEEVEDLQVTALELDFRVTELEENGGSDGNSSISELEVRVETLEGTAADHEARITASESEIEELEGITADHETRLTSAEENIQGLQMTDINHDARITVLEENGGDGGSQNETIAFHAVLTSYDTTPYETAVEFNEVLLNQGNGYNSTTGVFTVPSGGDGLYYFSTYLLVSHGEYARFDMTLNDDVICSPRGEHETSGSGDTIPATCTAVVSVAEGDEIETVLKASIDNTPLYASAAYYYNGFNGFRI